MFFVIIVILLVISFFWSLFSLHSELKKSHKTQQVTEELSKGRVIFQASSLPEAHQLTPESPEPVDTNHTG